VLLGEDDLGRVELLQAFPVRIDDLCNGLWFEDDVSPVVACNTQLELTAAAISGSSTRLRMFSSRASNNSFW
jgi:hypothetical protein